MTRLFAIPARVLLLLCLAGAVQAAGVPLEAFSEEADVIIRLQKPQETLEHAAAMATLADEKLGQQVRDNSPFIGLLISNPTMAGVDQAQDWLVVVHAHADRDPSVVYAIPATDPKLLEDALPEKFTHVARDGWVFYSEDAAAIESLGSRAGATTGGAPGLFSDKSRELFDRGHLSVFVNVAHLTDVYQEQLEQAEQEMAEQMDQRALMLQTVPGLDLGNAQSVNPKDIVDVLRNTDSVTVGLTMSDKGLHAETYGDFDPESDIAKFLGDSDGSALKNLGHLPAGALAYFGVSGELTTELLNLAAKAGADAAGNDAEKLQALEQLGELQYDNAVASLGLGTAETGLLRVVTLTETDNTAKIREITQASTEAMSTELTGQGIKQEATYEPDAETVGEKKVDLLTIKTTVDPNVNPFLAAMLGQIQKAVFGPSGIELRYVYWDDKYLQTLGGGPELAAEAVEAVENDAGIDMSAHRTGLIESPDVMMLIDVQRLALKALQAFAARPEFQLPIDPAVVNTPDPDPSYVGFSAVAEEDALRTKTQVPPRQLYRIVQLAYFARMAMRQR